MSERRDMLELTCELSDEEVLVRARAGATAAQELQRLSEAKAAYLDAHKQQVQEQAGTASRMSDCVRLGRERRLVACITEFHQPSPGKKRTTRLDTGELVKTDDMSPFELQENLFADAVAEPEQMEDAALQVKPDPTPEYHEDIG